MGAMISIVYRGRSVFLNESLRPLGLSAGQVPVLMLLATEQNITQETLVRHYHLDKGTIARAVRKLRDAGYVSRITDPGNRRAVRLFLTEKGERVIPVLHTINRKWEAAVFRGLSVRDKDAAHALMRIIAGNSFACLADKGEGIHADE